MFDRIARFIEQAKAGDTDAARRLLLEFRSTVRANRDKDGRQYVDAMGAERSTQFDERLLDYLGDCFSEILDGMVRADVALRLSHADGKRGRRPKKETREKSLEVGLRALERYQQLSGCDDMPPADNWSLDSGSLDSCLAEAFAAIAREMHRAPLTVLRDYRAWRDLVTEADEAAKAEAEAEAKRGGEAMDT